MKRVKVIEREHILEELEKFKSLGHGKLDFTIGSALDLFGGTIPYKNLLRL